MSVGAGYGKVILLGEHAVVYGEPALAGALGSGCEVRCEDAKSGPQLLLDAQVLRMDDADHAVARAVREAALAAALDVDRLDVSIRFALPVGAGLGSSAALAVALPRAMFAHAGKRLDDAALTEVAHRIESGFHGNPSGLDAKLAMSGALGAFTKAEGLVPLRLQAPLRLIIADSGKPRSTQTQVAKVAARKARLGAPIDAILRAIGEIARAGAEAIVRGDLARLGELMDVNHELLCALSVSTPELDALSSAARAAGAIGAKLTGAGGGGCVIALAPGREAEVAAALKPLCRTVLVSTLGAAA